MWQYLSGAVSIVPNLPVAPCASFQLDRVRQGGEAAPFIAEIRVFRDLIGDPPVYSYLHPDSPKPPMMTLLGATYRIATSGVGYGAIMIERVVDDQGTVEVVILAANESKTVELPAGGYNLKVV